MDLVMEYCKRAEECRVLACHVVLEEHKSIMLEIAGTWERMANQREAFLKRHPDQSDPINLAWRRTEVPRK